MANLRRGGALRGPLLNHMECSSCGSCTTSSGSPGPQQPPVTLSFKPACTLPGSANCLHSKWPDSQTRSLNVSRLWRPWTVWRWRPIVTSTSRTTPALAQVPTHRQSGISASHVRYLTRQAAFPEACTIGSIDRRDVSDMKWRGDT